MKASTEEFNAIHLCDKNYDGIFFYGVSSTRIFCKPSCKSRTPKFENIDIQPDAQTLLKLGYRPCKRCKPTNENLPDHEWIQQVSDFMAMNYTEKLTLEVIADETHSSPFHLHRKFKEIKGITIGKHLVALRMQSAYDLLQENPVLEIMEVGRRVGIPNSSQFVRDFKKHFGKTPGALREEQLHEKH